MFEYKKHGESTDKAAEMALKDCDKEEEEEICEMWKIYAENDIMCLHMFCPDELMYQEKVTEEEAEMALEDCEIDEAEIALMIRGEYIERRMREYERDVEKNLRDVCMHEHEAYCLYNEAVDEILLDDARGLLPGGLDVYMHEHEADYLYNGAVEEMLLDEGNMYVQEMRMRDMREREMHEREAEETLHDVSDFIYNGMGEIQAKDKALYE